MFATWIRSAGHLAALAAALIAMASPAAAQGAVSTFEELRVLVRTGDVITVVDMTGQGTKGKITRLSSSQLTLLVPDTGTSMEFREDQVAKVTQKEQDSLANGALAGLGIGASFLLVGASGDGEGLGVGVAFAAIGTCIGIAVDALITKDRMIYAPASRVRFSIVPVFTDARRGVVFAVRW